MTSAADLMAIQEIDLKRDSRRALIADIESRLVESDELVEAREAVSDAEYEVERLRAAQKALDDQSKDLDAKLQPYEKKLYDGSVRNPKELTDLSREVETLKAQRSKLDDSELALIEGLERANRALAEAQAELKTTQAAWEASQSDLIISKSKAERESEQLQGERDQRTKGMDASALGLYEKLRSIKQGRGVSLVQRGTCQGCRVSLPTHLVQRLRTGDQLIQCPRCERILVAG